MSTIIVLLRPPRELRLHGTPPAPEQRLRRARRPASLPDSAYAQTKTTQNSPAQSFGDRL
eukprot:8733366-Alexandrium_andersonii.AAC.1